MDLVQRALVWEASEPDVYVNVFFGFPFADVPDVGMTFQVLTNDNPALAAKICRDLAETTWRQREALLTSTKVHTIPDGVALAKQAMQSRETPVVLADHSDRSGSATWLLREIISQGLSNALIATIADRAATAKLRAQGAKAGDAFDMEIGGLVDESAGEPVRIQGTILNAVDGHGQFWVTIKFGRDNVLILSTYLVQVSPSPSRASGWTSVPSRSWRSNRVFISGVASTTTALPGRSCWSSRKSRFSERFVWTSSPIKTSTSVSTIHTEIQYFQAEPARMVESAHGHE
jgi:microcystin degradation protein MlrC